MTLGGGLSHRTACQTHGTMTVIVTLGAKVVARHRVKVSATCTYTTTFAFSAIQLPASGRMAFHTRSSPATWRQPSTSTTWSRRLPGAAIRQARSGSGSTT